MEVSIAVVALCLIVLWAIILIKLIKISKKISDEDSAREVAKDSAIDAAKNAELKDAELKEALRRQEQSLIVMSTKLEIMKAENERLSKAVDSKLGEMQDIAKDIGNLERVLTNVKTRGIWGELQAERILQDMLLPSQYDKNVITKRGSQERVEFAVKLPGANGDASGSNLGASGGKIYLPIDSKFPREDYERLCQATERGDLDLARTARRALEIRILNEAKDIRDKYIDVPYTTDFAILFLPTEGLYSEVLSLPGLQERLQREFHVMVAGPTTLSGLLNSLQMGFRTLAIEKKSSEVWHLLGEVKTEYGKFGIVLDNVKKKLALASNEVDNAFVRYRAMDRCLRDVEVNKDADESTPAGSSTPAGNGSQMEEI
jgi:DNA recombination protein RmuC